MVDLSKVEGPSGTPESFGKKDKGSIDAEKFKEAMRRRVTEVSQVDPDEQKKRKRREEAEEESLEETPQGPMTPPSQVTPFSLKEEQKKVSPMEKQGPGISPINSAQKSLLPSPSPTTLFQTPSTDEMADDSGVLEEESFIETVPSSQAPSPSTSGGETETPWEPQQIPEQMIPQAPLQQPSPTSTPSEIEQPFRPLESRQQKTDQPSGKAAAVKHPVGPPEKKPITPGIEPHLEGLKTEQQKQATLSKPTPIEKGITAEEMQGIIPSKTETAGFFEQFTKGDGEEEKEGKKSTKPLEELGKEVEIQEISITGQPLPFASEESKEKKVKENESPTEIAAGIPATVGELPTEVPPSTLAALPSYANIHPQVMEIFDRMVGVMTVMNMSGITETVITLNAPQFASSVFFGSQIIIQEFSTAPQAFNIQLNGTSQAVALFQSNVDDLMAAFQAGNYNFRVNRLETGYLTERPLFKRKEKAEDKEKDTGESRQ